MSAEGAHQLLLGAHQLLLLGIRKCNMPHRDFYPTEKQYYSFYIMHRRLHFCFDIKFYPHVAMLKGLHTSRSFFRCYYIN